MARRARREVYAQYNCHGPRIRARQRRFYRREDRCRAGWSCQGDRRNRKRQGHRNSWVDDGGFEPGINGIGCGFAGESRRWLLGPLEEDCSRAAGFRKPFELCRSHRAIQVDVLYNHKSRPQVLRTDPRFDRQRARRRRPHHLSGVQLAGLDRVAPPATFHCSARGSTGLLGLRTVRRYTGQFREEAHVGMYWTGNHDRGDRPFAPPGAWRQDS